MTHIKLLKKIHLAKVVTLGNHLSKNSGWLYLDMIENGNVFCQKLIWGLTEPSHFVFIYNKVIHSIREVKSAKVIVNYEDTPKPLTTWANYDPEEYKTRVWFYLGDSVFRQSIGKPRYVYNEAFKDCARGRPLVDLVNIPKMQCVLEACRLTK